MGDNDEQKQEPQEKWEHLDEEQKVKAEKAIIKLNAVRALKKMSVGSKWNLTQQVLQDIVATYVVADPNAKLPSTKKLVIKLTEEIQIRYKDQPELKQLMLDAIPSDVMIRDWFKREGWDEAVWTIIRSSGLFSKEKRATMIEALYKRGMEKDTVAAKIWLTLSGDYADKMDVSTKDRTVETFREINELLHKKEND